MQTKVFLSLAAIIALSSQLCAKESLELDAIEVSDNKERSNVTEGVDTYFNKEEQKHHKDAYYERSSHHNNPKKKEGFLSELFDF